MVGESFEFYMIEMAINASHSSAMIGENFEFYMTEMAINAL